MSLAFTCVSSDRRTVRWRGWLVSTGVVAIVAPIATHSAEPGQVSAPVDARATFSPDGKSVAFISRERNGHENNQLYVVSAHGDGLRRLTNDTLNVKGPAFSPDGNRLAFFAHDGQQNDIYAIDVDGTNLRQLTDYSGDNVDPSWSPDGTRMVFYSNRTDRFQLYVMTEPHPTHHVRCSFVTALHNQSDRNTESGSGVGPKNLG